MISVIIALFLALLYMILQGQYILYWKKIPLLTHNGTPAPGVSILIAARNESATIERCLRGLLAQDYPAEFMDIIVIDDHSTDGTASIIRQLHDPRIQIIALADYPQLLHKPAYKKSAITLGVAKARHDIIVVTDADCVHEKTWLRTIVHHFQRSGSVFQTAPVLLPSGQNKLQQMQEAEILALMLITGSGIQSKLHDIANGANMAFRRQAFDAVNGYEGNFHYASGDDLFLIEKMRTRFPDSISFVKSKDAIVITDPAPGWDSLLRQRVRWATKNKGLRKQVISTIWAFIGAYHIFMLLSILFAVFSLISWWPFIILLSCKWISDYLLLREAAVFGGKQDLLRHFIPLQILYTFYVCRMGWWLLRGTRGDWETRQ